MSSIWDYRECVWHYRESTWTLDSDLLGYDVVATDGCIGLVGHVASGEPGAYVVVETCSCIQDGKRLVPARAVASLDHDNRLVRVALTQDQIRRAPAYAADQWNDYVRTQHEDYYSAHGG